MTNTVRTKAGHERESGFAGKSRGRASGTRRPSSVDREIIGVLAAERFGTPNRKLSNRRELRFGRKGSVSVRLDDGRYYDHEQQRGGYLVKSKHKDHVRWSLPKQSKRQVQRPPLHQPVPLQKNNLLACEVWHQSIPLKLNDGGEPITENLDASPALRYMESRAITLSPYPETLAFARLPHPETKQAKVPTLVVARQCSVSGLLRGIQRIFLTEDGQKYPYGTVKMSLGSIRGGRAELIPVTGEELAIAEGVESALSAHILLGSRADASAPSRTRAALREEGHHPLPIDRQVRTAS